MQITNLVAALAALSTVNNAYSINRGDANSTVTANITSNLNVSSNASSNATGFGNTTASLLPEHTLSPFYSNQTASATAAFNASSFISGIPEATKNTTTVGPTYPNRSTLAGTAVTKASNTSDAHISITAAPAHISGNSSFSVNSSVGIASMEKYPPTDSQQSAALVSIAKKGKRDMGKAVFSSPKLIKLSQKSIEVALEKVYEKYPSLQGKISAADVTPNEDIFISVNGIGFTNNNE